ncbi:MAG TPA: helix-turn-helix domain-containing protein [Ktedonobacteraceae bacterium]|nr:helix-turn-helix domain-containing protein [Ktedonobacteraceae bacterium]
MFGFDPFSRFGLPLRWRKPASIIGLVGILAFVIWTLPNWGEFWGNVLQFPSLWQIPANRRIIIYLIIKVASPLLVMGIAAIVVWIYDLIKLSQENEATDTVRSEHMQRGTRAGMGTQRSTSFSMPEQTPETQGVPFSTVFRSQPVPQGFNPETPLPPTLSLQNALRKQREESDSSALLIEDEQPVPLADQKREMISVRTNSTVTSSIQPSNGSQPLALGSERLTAPESLISIRLLKDVSVTINIPGDGHVVVPLSLNAKRVQLLAYIAWRRGELIDRDKILEHVFGWGLKDEDATEDKLSERFESHKKLLRKKIKEAVIEQINKPAGRQRIDPDLVDPFVSNSGFWGLSDICRVTDLEAIEINYKIISLARKDGKLVDEIPEYVQEACKQIIANYPGDFLEALIKKFPSEFRPWQGHSSWVRRPYTHYRDMYLDALWYAAEYEWRMGQRYGDGGTKMEEADLRKQQGYFGRAAENYQSYAMYACNSKFDSKATFGAHGEYGERVGMSERALRRCVVLLGAIGKTNFINQVWSSYVAQMKSISDHRWQPSKETQADVEAASKQTNAYRFAAQMSQIGDFAERQGRVS